jgi:hypothetical protein
MLDASYTLFVFSSFEKMAGVGCFKGTSPNIWTSAVAGAP